MGAMIATAGLALWTFFTFTDRPNPVEVQGAPTFDSLTACTAELQRREVLGAFCSIRMDKCVRTGGHLIWRRCVSD